MIREPIYSAVFAYFAALTVGNTPLFKSATRRIATWETAAPEDQPMLLMRQRSEVAEHKKGLPTKWTLNVDLGLYVHTGGQNDPTIVASQVLNPLLDAIEAALTIDDLQNQACTLNGLVSRCSIEGVVDISLGSLGDEAVAMVPLVILVNII